MKIVLLNGVNTGQNIELVGPQITLGRETDNDVNIMADGVSRYHAKLVLNEDDSWQIVDLNSTNGVKVNREPVIGNKKLQEGDVIELGDQSLRFGDRKSRPTEVSAKEAVEPFPVESTGLGVTILPLDFSDEESNRVETATEEAGKVIFESVDKSVAEREEKSSSISFSPSGQGPKTADDFSGIAEALDGNADIFDGNKRTKNNSSKTAPEKKKRYFSNLIFYTFVICAAVVFIAIYYAMNREMKSDTSTQTHVEPANRPFVLNYVKEKIETDNVFRFSLLIENGKATFTIDDLRSQRNYTKNIDKIGRGFLDNLRKDIENTSFMTLAPQPAGVAANNQDETRRLTIYTNKKLNTVVVKNNYAPRSFEEVERAIRNFSEHYGMVTFAMTPEELKKYAEKSFYAAEDKFQNRHAKPGNLLEAIKHYRIAIDYLEQFSPKPAIWDTARKREQEAEGIRQARIKDLKYEYSRTKRLNELENAKAAAREIVSLTTEEEKDNKNALASIRNIDRVLRMRKKR